MTVTTYISHWKISVHPMLSAVLRTHLKLLSFASFKSTIKARNNLQLILHNFLRNISSNIRWLYFIKHIIYNSIEKYRRMTKLYSLADLKFISPVTLRSWLRGSSPGNFAIIDVRESDYIGGHIKGSLHYSAGSFKETLPDLKRTLRERDVDNVIFHCALSQVRGPRSALTFLRSIGGNELADPFYQKLQVYVLKGGFTKWQESYGEDPEATEDFDKEIWRF